MFDNINEAQANKIFAALNSAWNEVFWFDPLLDSVEIDSYVKYNYAEQLWDYGTLARTAWEDHEHLPPPLATDPTGYLYTHEVGNDADGMPMDAWAETGYVMIAEGDDVAFVERVLPDFASFQGSIALSVFAVDYPNSDTPLEGGPFTVIPGVTPYVITRLRGRGIALKLESNVLGGDFRLGKLRAKIVSAGKR